MSMNYEHINYELSVWRNSSLILDGVSMVKTIRHWWDGKVALSTLFIALVDLSCTLLTRYFKKPKHNAVAKAYNTLGLSPKIKNRNVISKRYKELTAIYHPDKGGSVEMMREINVARDIIIASL